MPRRREVPKRDILPDPKFGSVDVAKFVNVLMFSGKKSVAERTIYGALDQITKKSGKNALEVFGTALTNAKPMVEVKSRRVGGANYQVPPLRAAVVPSKSATRCIAWLRRTRLFRTSASDACFRCSAQAPLLKKRRFCFTQPPQFLRQFFCWYSRIFRRGICLTRLDL